MTQMLHHSSMRGAKRKSSLPHSLLEPLTIEPNSPITPLSWFPRTSSLEHISLGSAQCTHFLRVTVKCLILVVLLVEKITWDENAMGILRDIYLNYFSAPGAINKQGLK